MMETMLNRCRHRLLGVPLALAAAALAAGPAVPAAAQCYSRSPYLDGSNECGTETAGLQYELYASNRLYFVSVPGDKEYLIATMSNDLGVFDLTANPLNPVLIGSDHIPWDWSTINVGGSSHEPYIDHIRNIATLGGFKYGVAMLADYGWDFFKLAGAQSGFLGHGYHPAYKLQGSSYNGAALFQIGNNIYVAAQMLDQASITNNDFSIRIYKIGVVGNPAFTEALTPSNIAANSAIVPIGHPGDPLNDSQFSLATGGMKLFTMYSPSSGKTFVIASSFGSPAVPSTVAVVDVSNPTSPQLASFSQDPTLAGANIDMDEGHMMVWAGDRHVAKVYGYNVDPTSGAITGGPTVEYIAGAPSVSYSSPSVDGNLLVVTAGNRMGYVSLAGNGTPTVLQDTGVPPYSKLPTRSCLNTAYSESCIFLRAFVTGNHHYVARSLAFDQDIVGVSDSCISTVPSPDFTVTGGEAAATCQGPGNYTQADAGFPGDTFTINDTSAGVWEQATLDISTSPGGPSIGAFGGQNFPMTITPGQSVQLTPEASRTPGDFYVKLSISGGTPPSTIKVISLCNNPKAVLTVAVNNVICPDPAQTCTALVNDQVTLGDTGTPGTPSGTPTYLWGLVNTTPTVGSSFQPATSGNYTVGVIVPYAFTAPSDSTCTDQFFTGSLPSTGYYSCAIGTVNAGYGTASFQVEQPAGTPVAWDGKDGFVNVAQDVTLKFLGRLASGYTPSFQWSIPNVANSQLTCSYAASPFTNSTCTIAANTLPAGNAAPWNLTLNVCSQGGLGSPPGPCTGSGDPLSTAVANAVTVTPTQNSFTFSVNPTSVNVGDAITITLGTVLGTYSRLLFDLGGSACDGSTQLSYNCVTPFGNQCVAGARLPTFNYGASERNKVDTITATGTLTTGGSVTSPTQAQVSISSANTTCPCPTVSVSVGGPTSAMLGEQVQFSASASAPGYSITGYSWTFGDGGTGTGSDVTHAYTSAGSYTVRVTATSSCGNTGTDSMVIVVGGGNLTITPAPTNPAVGQRVTFTFSPALTQTGDKITFDFKDGSATSTISYNVSICGAGGCNSMTHTFTVGGVFDVSASGTAGGASVSGSTSVTVISDCQPASAPTAAFTWTRPVRSGQW